jgi:hypothetical protein
MNDTVLALVLAFTSIIYVGLAGWRVLSSVSRRRRDRYLTGAAVILNAAFAGTTDTRKAVVEFSDRTRFLAQEDNLTQFTPRALIERFCVRFDLMGPVQFQELYEISGDLAINRARLQEAQEYVQEVEPYTGVSSEFAEPLRAIENLVPDDLRLAARKSLSDVALRANRLESGVRRAQIHAVVGYAISLVGIVLTVILGLYPLLRS